MAKLFTILVGVAGVVGAIFTVLQFFTSAPSHQPPSEPEAQQGPVRNPPGAPTPQIQPPVDLTPDPSTAARTKVMLRSRGPALGRVAYSVTNLAYYGPFLVLFLWANTVGQSHLVRD